MQRRVIATVALLGLVLSGCSSSGDDGAAVEIRVEMAPTETSAFTASGAAVDDGLVCEGGRTLPGGEVQTIDGQPSSDEEFERAFDEALASEGVVEAVYFVGFACADDDESSDSFTMQQTVRIDFSEIDTAAFRAGELDQVPGGTWEISEGTGDLAGLSGGGDHVMDQVAGEVVFAGELTSD